MKLLSNKAKNGLNVTNDDEGATLIEDLGNEKRKNMLKWGLIGGAIFIVVILAIVLPITLRGRHKDPVDPDIKPPV